MAISNIIFAGSDNPNEIDISVISNQRGEQGEKGPQGDPGVGVSGLTNNNNHLVVTLSNGTTVDAGELPTEDIYFQYVGEMDGENNTYSISPAIDPDSVAYICINGVIYPTGYTLTTNSITFNFPEDLIPSGRLDLAIYGGLA